MPGASRPAGVPAVSGPRVGGHHEEPLQLSGADRGEPLLGGGELRVAFAGMQGEEAGGETDGEQHGEEDCWVPHGSRIHGGT